MNLILFIDTQNKILSEEQLAEVTRLLNQVKGHSQGQSQASSGAVNELLELLKHAQGSTLNQGSRSVRGQRQTGSHGDRHKPPTTGVKRNVQFNPAKVRFNVNVVVLYVHKCLVEM